MTDYTRDTPSLGRTYCPGCEPDTDPTLEILDVRCCDAHALRHEGVDDGLVSATAYLLARSRPRQLAREPHQLLEVVPGHDAAAGLEVCDQRDEALGQRSRDA